ncbi:cytidylyltransferase domain-containing protein [Pseudoalteromonas mariniglutinosa]|uniref:cytidylyltransferase domain-containing protein n=1 Tax=Pseudoalteromonas mariniglutinosa TaxID=206042 RepID=UPI003850438B
MATDQRGNSLVSALLEKEFYIIIQARMTSSRLPNKVLLPLGEKTVLEVMIDRLGAFKDKIIIATTNDGTQKPIVDLCEKLAIRYVEGDTDNVLSRYYLAAQSVNAQPSTVIVRCTSDCPLIDISESARVINYFFQVFGDYDYVSAGPHCGFPNGFDTEVFTFQALETAYQHATEDFEKEHMTQYICRHMRVAEYSNKDDYSHWRLTLDESADYELISTIYTLFNHRTDFNFDELKQMLSLHPDIIKINEHIEQIQVG